VFIALAAINFGCLTDLDWGTSWVGSAAGISTVSSGTVATNAGTYGGTFSSLLGSADGSTAATLINGYLHRMSFDVTKPTDAALRAREPTTGTTDCTTYYVAAAGLDTNSGCSTTTPWQTIAKVNSAAFSPGSSVLFNGGDSFSGCILLSRANIPSGGNKTNPIVFGAY